MRSGSRTATVACPAPLGIGRSLLAKGQLDRALALAGRLLHELRDSPKAFNLNGIVQEAASRRAAALGQAKDTAAARRILDALLAKPGDFPSRAAAEELLKKLG